MIINVKVYTYETLQEYFHANYVETLFNLFSATTFRIIFRNIVIFIFAITGPPIAASDDGAVLTTDVTVMIIIQLIVIKLLLNIIFIQYSFND